MNDINLKIEKIAGAFDEKHACGTFRKKVHIGDESGTLVSCFYLEIEEELDPLPLITYSEAIKFYDNVILYLEQQERTFNIKKEELKFVKKLKKKL